MDNPNYTALLSGISTRIAARLLNAGVFLTDSQRAEIDAVLLESLPANIPARDGGASAVGKEGC